jgi:glucokinase
VVNREVDMAVMLGVDIGGTKMAVAPVDEAGRIVGVPLVRPSRTESTEHFLDGLVQVVRDALAASAAARLDVVGVGLGCAGMVDWTRGIVVASPHLPLHDTPVRSRVATAIGLPTTLDNDANVAALAETRVGAAKGLRHVVMLTLGTGVGGGLVLGGRVYRGATGAAAELGHMRVASDGEPCNCGSRGCLEAYASGRALERVARRLVQPPAGSGAGEDRREEGYASGLASLDALGRLTGEAVGVLALQGDAAAGDAVREVAEWLGVGVTSLANVFNPEMIVVGGGLVTLGDLLLGPARAALARCGLSPNREVARVEPAALGNDAGLVGAALVAWERQLGV